MKVRVEPSFTVTVYVAGDLAAARESLRRQCMEEGLCVTLTATDFVYTGTDFVYTGGAESGVAVGLVNYPRFPSNPEAIKSRALKVAEQLIADLHQWSAMVVTPTETLWLDNHPEAK